VKVEPADRRCVRVVVVGEVDRQVIAPPRERVGLVVVGGGEAETFVVVDCSRHIRDAEDRFDPDKPDEARRPDLLVALGVQSVETPVTDHDVSAAKELY